MSTWPAVTVTVLTFNGEQYLADLLRQVDAQEYAGEVEVLVIDSGSTDGTLGIVRSRPNIRLHEIPNEQFGHGRTRNLAAELATGEIVVYLTHDAVPIGTRWLQHLVAPFVDDPRVAAVVGSQVARASAPPVMKYDIRRVFDRLGPAYGIAVVWDDGDGLTQEQMESATFYSDVNSAVRREVVLAAVPYRDVAYAEDQVFGRDLFKHGFRRAFTARAAVEHSNDVTLRTFGRRIRADALGLRQIGTILPTVSRRRAFAQFVRWSSVDSIEIVADRDFTPMQKLKWLVLNPMYHLVKWRAFRLAVAAPVDEPDDRINR